MTLLTSMGQATGTAQNQTLLPNRVLEAASSLLFMNGLWQVALSRRRVGSGCVTSTSCCAAWDKFGPASTPVSRLALQGPQLTLEDTDDSL